MRDYKSFAEKEINKYAEKHEHESNAEFNKNVHALLVKKYYWRHWFILTFDPSLNDFRNGRLFVGSHAIYWDDKYKRSLYISSTNDPSMDRSDTFYYMTRNCIFEKRRNYEWSSVSVVHKDISTCLPLYNGIVILDQRTSPWWLVFLNKPKMRYIANSDWYYKSGVTNVDLSVYIEGIEEFNCQYVGTRTVFNFLWLIPIKIPIYDCRLTRDIEYSIFVQTIEIPDDDIRVKWH